MSVRLFRRGALFLLFFALWAGLGESPNVFAAPSPAPSPAAPAIKAGEYTVVERLEATVNSSLILLSDLKKFRQTMPLRAQLDPLFAGTPVAQAGPKAADAEIVQFLINEKLIEQQLPVSDSEVEQEISGILANNHLDRPQLKETLKDQGFAYDDYFELIRSESSKRNLIDRDIRTKVTVSDDDVKNQFLNKYARDPKAPKSYRVRLIALTVKNYKSAAAARQTAEEALKQLRSGDSFEDVARRISDDPSAVSGGDLGEMQDDQMSTVFKNALHALQVGQTSDVLASGGQYVILKLADVTTSEDARYEKMKDEIRNQLVSAEYQHQIALWIERQRQGAFIHVAGESSLPGVIASSP